MYVLLILVVVVLSLTLQGTVLVSIHLAVSLCGVVSVCNYLYSYDHTFVVACAAGCRACTGPNNADCLQCEDDNRYRVTTNQPASSACVTANECVTPAISTFGDRTCNMVRSTSQGVSLRYGTRIVNILIVCNVFVTGRCWLHPISSIFADVFAAGLFTLHVKQPLSVAQLS